MCFEATGGVKNVPRLRWLKAILRKRFFLFVEHAANYFIWKQREKKKQRLLKSFSFLRKPNRFEGEIENLKSRKHFVKVYSGLYIIFFSWFFGS